MTDTATLPAPSPPSARRPEAATPPPDPAPAPATMDDVLTALDPDDFPGCRAVSMTSEEFDDYDGRVEVWDAATGTAMVCEAAGLYHEEPSHRLAQMTALIALTRGAHISVVGSTDLLLRDEHGARRRIMEADQTVYLHPERGRPDGPAIVMGEDVMPDVVVEVDNTTDVRRRKLALYESWKLPEVWVEVPDVRSPSRAKNREPGLTIHVLRPDGRYRPAAESRAFPGWTADEIHRAMNEPVWSAETMAVLERVGRALRDRDGAGPGDAPFLQRTRAEGHGPRAAPKGGRRATPGNGPCCAAWPRAGSTPGPRRGWPNCWPTSTTPSTWPTWATGSSTAPPATICWHDVRVCAAGTRRRRTERPRQRPSRVRLR